MPTGSCTATWPTGAEVPGPGGAKVQAASARAVAKGQTRAPGQAGQDAAADPDMNPGFTAYRSSLTPVDFIHTAFAVGEKQHMV